MFQNWHNALIALHFLDGFEARLINAKQKSELLFKELSKIEGIRIETFKRGSNTAKLFVTPVNHGQFSQRLFRDHKIAVLPNRIDKFIPLKVNETLLDQSNEKIVAAFRDTLLKG